MGVVQCKVLELEWDEEGIHILGAACMGLSEPKQLRRGSTYNSGHGTECENPNESRKASVLRRKW